MRVTFEVLRPLPLGTVVTKSTFEAAMTGSFSDRISPASLVASLSTQPTCWLQSGHLQQEAASRRVRARPTCRPTAVAYALWLGHLEGLGGDDLFTSRWVALLDAPRGAIDDQAGEAARQGLIDLRRGGGVTSVGFRYFSGNTLLTHPPGTTGGRR